jgi:hypothetical protein
VHCGYVKLFKTGHNVDGCLHGCVGRTLVTIGLHLHASGHTGEGLSASEVSDVNEGVVPGSEDVAHSEDVSGGVLRTKGTFLFGLCNLLSSAYFSGLSGLLLWLLDLLGLLGLLGFLSSRSGFCLFLLHLSHNIKLIFYK